jgi:uncharacterized membrane protein
MNCTLSALAGVGLLGASALTMSVSKEQTNSLRRVLSGEAAERYEHIVKERTAYYFQGLVLGIVLAFVILYYTKITNKFHKTSLAFGIALFTSALYYMVMPKSDYMLVHLKTKEENEAWLRVYKTMKYRYITGFLLGAAAAVPLSMALC